MNPLEKKLSVEILNWCDENGPRKKARGNILSSVTPGLRLQVVQSGRLKADLALGQTYKYYDLASLTKIIFTVPALMKLVDEGSLGLKDSVSGVLGWLGTNQIKMRDVLSHSAGLPWWEPFYKHAPLVSRDYIRDCMQKILRQAKPSAKQKAVYSDIDFILLGFVLEELQNQTLLDVWESLDWRSITPSFHFNVAKHLLVGSDSGAKKSSRKKAVTKPIYEPKYDRELYAPTEKCPWRKKILQGEVHDDNTWSFGGVSTHSGLFGSIDDVTEFGLMLRAGYYNRMSIKPGGAKSTKLAAVETVNKFTERAISKSQGDWALGFMMPTKGGSSAGQHFNPQSFGHTGFTGTSLWYDPKKDLLVSLLSNRVHPTRDNASFAKLRPAIHDFVCENI